MTATTRVEHDSMGELEVPASALWGAQTQRALQNFPPSGLAMPRAFIRALGLIKHAAAGANAEFGDLPLRTAAAIQAAALEVAAGRHDQQFPVDVFQTGSGTSSNMNANEVIAALASRALGERVHANDQVNMGQSSNDVVPTAIHVAAALLLEESLLPAVAHLRDTLRKRAAELAVALFRDMAGRSRRRSSAVSPGAIVSRYQKAHLVPRWSGLTVPAPLIT